MALLDKIKAACRVTSEAYDDELTDLALAAFADLGTTDIKTTLLTQDNVLPLVQQAVITYCKLNFGYVQLDVNAYARLKAAYDEQKAQLSMNSTYTDWSDGNA